MRARTRFMVLSSFVSLVVAWMAGAQPVASPCGMTLKADVVAIDQAFYNNRIGAFQSGGMIFALRSDIVPIDTSRPLSAGNVMLRASKRPRPLVLRVNEGDCLQITFENLLRDVPSIADPARYPITSTTGPYKPNENANVPAYKPSGDTTAANMNGATTQPATRMAGVHVMGMNLLSATDGTGAPVEGIRSDGSWVGSIDVFNSAGRGGLIPPSTATNPSKITYLLYAPAQGSYLLYSTAATNGLGPNLVGGQLSQGLFGAVTVHPKKSEFYRSQVTRDDLMAATVRATNANVVKGPPGATVKFRGQSFPVWIYKPAAGTRVILIDDQGNPGGVGSMVHTTNGQPVLDYGAKRTDGMPILRMTDDQGRLISSDLTAVITGPNAGPLAAPQPGNKSIYPDSQEPYREFVLLYHDDFVTTQAFPQFNDATNPVSATLSGGRDFFAINYGIGGIGPEILANRLGVGAMWQCATCRFEEFFLSSWTNGDPAQVVDVPANAQQCAGANCTLKTGPKATMAYYPDDPSNVYHSYMSDHVKFQVLHAGTNITHVHHLHAHQWLHTEASDTSAYRDSQMISPGIAYTMNHVYDGSGNRNKTVGDAIFHCHFYPHFAEGMWSLWRVHDTFEEGTQIGADGKVVTGPNVWNRALPDGEIAGGTPTPALVPLPTIAMAPMPARVRMKPVTITRNGNPLTVGYMTEVNPADTDTNGKPLNAGYPFFIPGIAGQRAPHPPLDFAVDTDSHGQKVTLDGGLPRSIGVYDPDPYQQETRWDFTKENSELTAVQLAEDGEPNEKVAMATHAVRNHPSFTPEGKPAAFVLNGRPPAQGAPYADPAVNSDGTPVCNDPKPGEVLDPEGKQPCLIRYKAADIQMDAVINKRGWHYPQTRLITLWGDVQSTIDNKRMPQPFFFRANSRQVIEYWLANLVPNFYELDDFQVRTPTDIIGQHIHLVKFDVTSSDGAANGYNYEDGTLSPDEVRDQIANINKVNGLFTKITMGANGFQIGGAQSKLTAKPIPYFGNGHNDEWLGAQATVQRWYADPQIQAQEDRTLRTVFTHDHFGPSTHQQTGLYAGLLVEPTQSQWFDPETGTRLGSNQNRPLGANGRPPMDGGPTLWQANIVVPASDPSTKSYREFAIEFADRQLAYLPGSVTSSTPYVKGHTANYRGWSDPSYAVSAPSRPGGQAGQVPPPWPQLVTTTQSVGSYSVNYRNEPLPYRVAPGASASASDLASVFMSIKRNDPLLNVQPVAGTSIVPSNPAYPFKYPQPFTGAGGTDPYTPLLRAYEGDNVQIRTLVGAHMVPHSFTIHGTNWLFEPKDLNSGFRGTQPMGISEHYEMLFHVPNTGTATAADYLYSTSSDTNGLTNGNWGLLRAYAAAAPLPDLKPIPAGVAAPVKNPSDCTSWSGVRQRTFNVQAMRVADYDSKFPLYYNTRGMAGANGGQQLVDPNAIIYVLAGSTPKQHRIEPLVLRANAGDCITINLQNAFSNAAPPGQTTLANATFTLPITITASASDITSMMQLLNINTYNTQFQTLFNANPWGFQLPADPTQTTVTNTLNNKLWTIAMNNSAGPRNFVVSATNSTTLSVAAQIPLSTSSNAGLHAQLLAYDVTSAEGLNVGNNPTQTAAPGNKTKYVWYAGRIENGTPTPVEFGSVNLTPADPLRQHPYGLLGALIVEPQHATWKEDSNSSVSALVTDGATRFREFVTVVQDDIASMQMTSAGAGTKAGLTISGGSTSGSTPVPAWIVGGQAAPNNATYVITPGEVVQFTIASGKHGVAFATEAAARAFFDIAQPGSAFADRPVPPGSGTQMWATAPTQCPQVFATLHARAPVGSKLPFECSQHGTAMAGTFIIDNTKADLTIAGQNNSSGGHQWALNGVLQANNSTYKVKPGQIVRFEVGSGFHGMNLLATQAVVAAFFDVLPASQTLGPTGVNNGFGTPGMGAPMVMATLRVKNVANGTQLPFECTIHTTNMAGTFVVDTTPSGGTHTLSGSIPSGVGPSWMFDGTVQPNDAHYALKPGDTLTVNISNGTHGLTLLQSADLAKYFTVVSGSFVPQTKFGTNAVGTNPQSSGTIAVLTVKSGVNGSAPFLCTQHGTMMAGTFDIGTATGGHTLSGAISGGPTWEYDGVVKPNNSSYALAPGDTLTVNIKNGTHGLTLLHDADLSKFFTVVSGTFVAQTKFGPDAVGTNPQSSGTIAVLKVNTGVNGSVPFLCTQHGTMMAGTFVIGKPAANQTLSGDLAPGPVWSYNGTVMPNNASYTLSPGDTLTVNIKTGTHGLTFLNGADLGTFFTVVSGTFKPQAKFGATALGTDPQNSGTVAVLQVKAGASGSANFLCTQHGAMMAGTFVFGDVPVPPTGLKPTPGGFTYALNYKTEPLQYRFAGGSAVLDNFDPCGSLSPLGISRLASNTLTLSDPQTPVFVASAGMPARMRMLHPGGLSEEVLTLHGHNWQEEPYANSSTTIGSNPTSNHTGSRDAFGPNVSWDLVLDSAGGVQKTPGDYFFRTFIGNDFQFGLWGILRVSQPGRDAVTVTNFPEPGKMNTPITGAMISGVNSVNPDNGQMADFVRIESGAINTRVPVDTLSGQWSLANKDLKPPVKVTSLKCTDPTCSTPQTWGSVTATGYIQVIAQNALPVGTDTIDTSVVERFKPLAEQTTGEPRSHEGQFAPVVNPGSQIQEEHQHNP